MQLVDQRQLDWKDKISLFLLSAPVSLSVPAGAVALSFFTGASHGAAKWWFGSFAVLLTLVSGLIAWQRQSKTGGYRRIAAKLALATAGAGHPVLFALGRVCKADNGDLLHTIISLRERVLDTARMVCGNCSFEKKRAVLYEFSTADDMLTFSASAGRAGDPRPTFSINDVPLGRAVVEFAQRKADPGKVDRVNDIRNEKPRGSLDLHRATYRSFISVPVTFGSDSYGLLAVDSTSPSAFAESDEGTVTLLAAILAAGLAHLEVVSQKWS